jgi:gas vesicle protein
MLLQKGDMNMGRFLNGVLIGIGLGLLVAPMRGEEMRRLVSERYGELQSSLPDNEQLKQAGQQVASGVSQMASQVKDYAQQAASQVKATGSSLGDLGQQAAREMKHTGQDIANTTKQTATSMKQGEQWPTTIPAEGSEEPILSVDDKALDEGL